MRAPLEDPATFAGITYDMNCAYEDRNGDVWFFEDTINAQDDTWNMSSSADCYLNSLADVVLHWGPLKPHGRRPHHGPEQC
ncbi:phiSA1p31-related protein [Streptomyces decoyicus]|uniref:phiSA1p31-related protein n=1 Tax=Streptomyces decoyicus TaxID=249567 RepID=UPI002F90B25D